MICCDDTFLYKMSCSKSIAAYLSSKIDFYDVSKKVLIKYWKNIDKYIVNDYLKNNNLILNIKTIYTGV